MELGQLHTQNFASLLRILGAATLALTCDFLRARQVRELAIELEALRAQPDRKGTSGERSLRRAMKREMKRAIARPEAVRPLAPEALAAMERGARLAGAPRDKAMKAPPPAGPVKMPRPEARTLSNSRKQTG